MDNNQLLEFINSPDTVDFIAQENDFFRQFVQQRPYIVTTATLSGGYVITYISRQYIEQVLAELGIAFPNSESTVLGLLGREALESSGILQVQQQPFLSLRGQGVIVGIVDTGIDYTSNVFRYEDGTTKIISIYDQTILRNPPYNFALGAEYTREEINAALASDDPLSVVPSVDTVGHGTFLSSIAAGREVNGFLGAAPDAELIVVKLKRARPYYIEKYLIPPEVNAFESSAVMVGIEYIIKKAQELGRPAAICIGVGTNFGSHDGFSLFEEYTAFISNMSGFCLCVAAGNESQARHHFLGNLEEEESTVNVELRVGENAGSIYMTMWNRAADRVSVSIRSPTGEIVQRVPAKSLTVLESRLTLERAIVIVEYVFPSRGNGAQNTVIKIIDATPGVWTITVYGDIVINGEFHVWLPITGFVSPDVEFLSPNPYYTVVIPATAIGPITCGGYNDFEDSLYDRTSWGPTRLPAQAPDLVAPAVNVEGIFPWGVGVMSGTSVASAITTGAGALMLQWGAVVRNNLAINTCQIRAYLIRGAERSPDITYPSPQWGYGKLNLLQAFNAMR